MTPRAGVIGWAALAVLSSAALALYGLVRWAVHLDDRRARNAVAGKRRTWTPENVRFRS